MTGVYVSEKNYAFFLHAAIGAETGFVFLNGPIWKTSEIESSR
jgi:hypothetical protein